MKFYRTIQVNQIERLDHSDPNYWIVRFQCQFTKSELPDRPGYTHFKVAVLFNLTTRKLESMVVDEEIPCANDDDLERFFRERVQSLEHELPFEFNKGIYIDTYGLEHLNESQKT